MLKRWQPISLKQPFSFRGTDNTAAINTKSVNVRGNGPGAPSTFTCLQAPRRKMKRLDQKSINQQRAEDAQQRIADAVAQIKRSVSSLGDLSVRDLAQRIARLAKCSLKTLYKYSALWRVLDPPVKTETCVTAEPEPVLSDRGECEFTIADPPEPREIKVLHTKGGDMKRRPTGEAPLPQTNSSSRGVRGDFPGFPQVPESKIPAPIPFEEVHAAIQQKVSRLNWSLEQVCQFLAEHFQGRDRIRQLQLHELTTYLYYLETEGITDEPAVCSLDWVFSPVKLEVVSLEQNRN